MNLTKHLARITAALAGTLALAGAASAQLNPGDIAIIGLDKNGSPVDRYAFVTLAPIPAGTVFYITDNGWTGTGFRGASATDGNGNEQLTRWTINNAILAGRIIRSTDSSPDFTIATGTIPGTTTNWDVTIDLSQSGEQLHLFQNTNSTNPHFNIATASYIYQFDDTGAFENATSSSTGSLLPGLTVPNYVQINAGTNATPDVAFNTSVLTSGTKAEWLDAIDNPANWVTGTTDNLPSGTISVTGGAISVASLTYAGGPDFSAGQNVDFTVTLSAAPTASPATVEITSSAFSAPVTVNISAPATSATGTVMLVSPMMTTSYTATATALTNATGSANSPSFNVVANVPTIEPLLALRSLPAGNTLNAAFEVKLGVNPVQNNLVSFSVVSGPNTGAMGSVLTNSSGLATFTYTSNGTAGTDTISASTTVSSTMVSNFMTVQWSNAGPFQLVETLANPQGTDQGQEFFEIYGPANTSLVGWRLVVIEGDGTVAGTVDQSIDLSAFSTGANGLLLIRDDASVLAPAPDAGTSVGVFDFSPDIENDNNTFLLGRGDAPPVGVDIDVANNGTANLALFFPFQVVDAMAYFNSDSPGQLYADDFGGFNFPILVGTLLNTWTPDTAIKVFAPNGTPCQWAAADTLGSAGGPFNYDFTETFNLTALGFTNLGLLQVGPGVANIVSPAVTTQPSAQTVNVGDLVTFNVSGVAVGYQWRRNAVDLVDGGSISGATTSTLTISPAAAADAGTYDVVLTSPCGTVTSTGVELTVNGGNTCPLNFDDTGSSTGVIDLADLNAFFDAWGAANGTPCAGPCPLNFDDTGASTGVIDLADLNAFFDAWGAANGTPCP